MLHLVEINNQERRIKIVRLLGMVASSTPSPPGAGATPSRPPPVELRPRLQRRNIDVEDDSNGGPPFFSLRRPLRHPIPPPPSSSRPIFISVTIPKSLRITHTPTQTQTQNAKAWIYVVRSKLTYVHGWQIDVNKDSQASEVFKSVHLAYETDGPCGLRKIWIWSLVFLKYTDGPSGLHFVTHLVPNFAKTARDSDGPVSVLSGQIPKSVLSNNTTRSQYDKSLHFQPKSSPPWRTHNINFEYEMKTHRWSDSRQKMKYRKGYGFDEVDGVTNERGSFINVVRSAFLSLFLLKTIGAKLSLTFSSVTALLDPELDGGYKVGYLVAWMMGGRGGIMLALCLPFASWICGKASSNVVALGAVSMWVGSVLARAAPLPQGAVLTLLYMSFKLQADLN
uniref:Uncharacterized protein n=2 Tax=Helianthus annuus TaxID=4232 RepID=A0A251VJR1_HELAN